MELASGYHIFSVIHGAQACCEQAVALVKLPLLRRSEVAPVGFDEAHGRGDAEVLVQGLLVGIAHKLLEAHGVGQEALGVHLVGIAREVSLVLVADGVEEGRLLVWSDVLHVFGHQLHEEVAVGVLVVVLEEPFSPATQAGGRCGGPIGVFAEEALGAHADAEGKQHQITTDEASFE